MIRDVQVQHPAALVEALKSERDAAERELTTQLSRNNQSFWRRTVSMFVKLPALRDAEYSWQITFARHSAAKAVLDAHSLWTKAR